MNERITEDIVREHFNKINLPKYAQKLNDELHAMKVKESQRCLLISGVLIALKNKSFKEGYKSELPSDLANRLLETIQREFKKSLEDGGNGHNQGNKIQMINSAYDFIKMHPALSKDPDNPKIKSLRALIEDVENNVLPLINNSEYDVISQFYVEFLQYSNSDKGLGIVLTPSHISDFFSEISNVGKDNILLDNCTGTGGFLISGMKHMISDANGDNKKIEHIKKHQIIGIEYDSDIYALSCSNMYIHGDGKSRIEHGSCFYENIIEKIKEYHPDIGHLNPPYKSEKTDHSEFKFILNNLSILEKGGTCVAIIPMSCVLAQSGEELEFKKEILNKHTLRAVFSMPSELFINSNVGVVTCIVVIEAHKPHPKGQEVYFGYCKDDGLIKRKPTGRQDYLNKWEGIKNQWINNYRSGKEVPGFSVKKYVTAKDEWCAEAYMETDYSTITTEDFIKSIRDNVVYTFSNNLIKEATIKSVLNENQKINTYEWRYYKLSDIFDILKGKRLIKENIIDGTLPFVSAIDSNNGIRQYIDNTPLHEANTITVNCGGSIGEAFYQEIPYFSSDSVNSLYPKFKLNKYIGMFLITVIRKEKYRFNFGRQWNAQRMSESTIKLPTTPSGVPDFEFMENYIKSLPYSASL